MRIYTFGEGHAQGDAGMKERLGGKGAGLAEMCRIGLPVPAGFTLPTDLCPAVIEAGRLPDEALALLDDGIRHVEKAQGRRFGDPERPLLLSVRSGARSSMPGMMDTVLNLGLNDAIAEGWAAREGDARFVWDAYRRFVHMFADVVLGLTEEDEDPFADRLAELKRERGAATDLDLDAEDLKRLVADYKALVEERAPGALPEDPRTQLARAVEAVFLSWNNPRAQTYRKLHGIPSSWGTACNVQAMVFGDRSEASATGVCFTRDPSSGAPGVVGEALESAQGEDVVAGVRTPLPLDAAEGKPSFRRLMPEAYATLIEGCRKLEAHFTDMQDIEFTVDSGKLWFLQTRTGKRTARAAVRIAVDMVDERLCSIEDVLLRVDADALEALLRPEAAPEALAAARADGRKLCTGLAASPGTGVGVVCLTSAEAVARSEAGDKVILVRRETSADDIPGMAVAQAILTVHGGMTSHAAVVARGMGRPAVVGSEELEVDLKGRVLRADGRVIPAGEQLTVCGTTGEVFTGALQTRRPETDEHLARLLAWADERRRLKVRANADTPEAARMAHTLGAQGIGLCRTEHMFFAPERILAMREMILAEDEDRSRAALDKLLPMQRQDFVELFEAMEGQRVTIRLLDPPLHEFLPQDRASVEAIAQDLGLTPEHVAEVAERHHEQNPMLGHRGCRLAITRPEVARMQARAALLAALDVTGKGQEVDLELMVPLVADKLELERVKGFIDDEAGKVFAEAGREVPYKVGTMIELPRACLVADRIAELAEFFSFGTNDLTQTTFGLSRDDAGKFLPAYLETHLLERDPFRSLDTEGVGQLIEMATTRGRHTRPDLEVGLCGEQGGDPWSIGFCHDVGLDYVSCSPFRVPGARLAAAQAALRGHRPKQGR